MKKNFIKKQKQNKNKNNNKNFKIVKSQIIMKTIYQIFF